MTAGIFFRNRACRAGPLPVCSRRCAVSETMVAMAVFRYPWSVLVEQRAHRLIAVLVADRFGHEPRDRQHFQPLELLRRREADGVGHVTSSMGDPRSRSTAGPESKGWVAKAKMRLAPSPLSAAEASVIVPAVSIMSSGMRQSLPSTSPTTFTTSATLAEGRRLSMMASDAFSRLANPPAIFAVT